MDRLKHRKKSKSKRWKKILFSVLVLFLAVFGVFGYWNYRNFASASNKLFGSANLLDVALPAELKSNSGRVNLLIAGYGIDKEGHGGADLTDTIMVISLDKTSNSGYMLSIPRDFYVNIPGRGQAKINEAYQVGESTDFSEAGYPSGGMGLLEKVINDTYGIDIHYYAIVDFTTVKEVVDALGGVTVTIKSDDPRGIYDPNFEPELGGPLKLSNGKHEIDGTTALKLTRARGSNNVSGSYGFPSSDFNRTQNQQLVMQAIKRKLTWKLILDPQKNGDVLEAFANNVNTDIRLSEAGPLYNLLTKIPEKNIKSVGLHDYKEKNYYSDYTSSNGTQTLIPADGVNNYASIQSAIEKLND